MSVPTTAAPGDPVVAKVGDFVIRASDFQEEVSHRPPSTWSRMAAIEQRKAVLKGMISLELQVQLAIKEKVAEDPETARVVKNWLAQQLRKKRSDAAGGGDVPDAELRSYYDANKADYVKPAESEASAVLIAVAPNSAKDAWTAAEKKAKETRAELVALLKANPKGFAEFASTRSDDPVTRARRGDLGWLRKGEVKPPAEAAVVDAAFGLTKVDELSGLVKGERGFWIVQLTGRRDEVNHDFNEMKEKIRQLVGNLKSRESFDKLLKEAETQVKTEVFEDALKAVEMPKAAEPTPMAAPQPVPPMAQPPAPPPPPAPAPPPPAPKAPAKGK